MHLTNNVFRFYTYCASDYIVKDESKVECIFGHFIYLKYTTCTSYFIMKQDAEVMQSNTKSPTGVHRPFIK